MKNIEIPEKVVTQIWTEIGNLQSKAKAEALAGEFTKKQSYLAEYILAKSHELSEEAQELGFYLGMVVWSCYEKYFGGNLDLVQTQLVKLKHEEMISESEVVSKNKTEIFQPFIMNCINEALFESNEEEDSLTEDEAELLFMILSVEVRCLNLAIINK